MSQKMVSVAVKGIDGKVILEFDRSIRHLEIEPQNCFDISEAMAAAAFECREGVKPVGKALKAEIVDRHRLTLTHRISLMLNSLREDKTKSNGIVAKQIVDTMLSEVF